MHKAFPQGRNNTPKRKEADLTPVEEHPPFAGEQLTVPNGMDLNKK